MKYLIPAFVVLVLVAAYVMSPIIVAAWTIFVKVIVTLVVAYGGGYLHGRVGGKKKVVS